MIRANSLRSILIDTLFLLLAVLVAATATRVYSAELAADLRPDPTTTDDSIDSRQNTDDNLPSGDPTESPAAKNQTIVLGMTLHNAEDGRALVREVAATSPAWDAGIRAGDELVELHGLRPTDFPKWSKDVRDVLRETQDGQAVPVVVERDGERLTLRAKLPVARAAAVREARQEEQAIAEMAQGQQGQMPQPGQTQGQGADRIVEYGRDPYGYPGGYAPGGGVGVAVGDGMGSNGSGNSRATTAVAELQATGNLGSGVSGQAGQLSGAGRVGTAVFENSQQGVAASVEVTGLPQGSYLVGIADGGMGTGFVNPFLDSSGGAVGPDGSLQNGAMQNGVNRGETLRQREQLRGRNRGQLTPQQRQQMGTPQGLQNQPNSIPGTFPGGTGTPGAQGGAAPTGTAPGGSAVPSGATPAAGGATGQSSSLANPDGAAYLAQQIDVQAQQSPQGAAQQATQAGPRAQVGPGQPGINNRTTGTATPGSAARAGQSELADRQGMNTPVRTAGGNMPNFLMEIGVLQVGVDGFGQVQNQLDGVNVQSLAGLQVAVVPSILEGTGRVGTATNTSGVGAAAGRVDPARGSTARDMATGQAATSRRGQQAPLGNEGGGSGPVATGIIQLVEGRGLPQQQPTDPNERARERQLEQAQRRDFSPPSGQTYDPRDVQGTP